MAAPEDRKGATEMTKLELAIQVCVDHHVGQRRKYGGAEYYTHPLTVAMMMRTDEERIVAVLHDTIEDTDVTYEEIRTAFGSLIANAVYALSRRDGESYVDFIQRVKTNHLAARVKICDIRHNMTTLPEGHGLRDRYTKALKALEGE